MKANVPALFWWILAFVIVGMGFLLLIGLVRAAAYGDKMLEDAARRERIFRHEGRTVIDLTRKGDAQRHLTDEDS